MGVGDSALRRPRSNQPKGGRREEEQGREQLHVELSPSCSRRRAPSASQDEKNFTATKRKENRLSIKIYSSNFFFKNFYSES